MGFLFKTVKIYIYNLGLFCANVVNGAFKGIFSFIASIPRRLTPQLRKTFSSAWVFVRRFVALAAVIALVVGVVKIVGSANGKTDAFAVMLNGETAGYVETEDEAKFVKTAVAAKSGLEDLEITYESANTLACNIKSADTISEILAKTLNKDLIKVCELYVDGEYICSVSDSETIRTALNAILKKAQAQYPNSSVSFTQDVSFSYAYRSPDDASIWSAEKLRLILSTLEIVTVRHSACERTVTPVDFDTVEIQTNTLFIGDSRVRREGTNGSEYVIDLVTYEGEKKVLSQKLMSVTVTAPVSRVIERGMRAGSLSMGTYTVMQTSGYFCWPVVGLFTVTSEFGERSLGYHHGLDISGASASGSLVVAGASGTVIDAGYNKGGYGNYVQIDHGNGVETLYAHMLDGSLSVTVGDKVTKGQAIGRVGNTGYSFGAHLHFEVRINGNRVNPAPYLGL